MNQPKVSIVIIAKNEERQIKNAVKSGKWADEVILLDTGSTDHTVQYARQAGVTKFFYSTSKKLKFADWRTKGAKIAQGEWLFYLDADEEITPGLKKEIKKVIKQKNQAFSAFSMPRRNFLLGKELHYGGWWPDKVKRLFLKQKLKKWTGELHEEPVFQGKLGCLQQPLIHHQPKKLEPMLKKSIQWAPLEAQMLKKAGHPPVVWWRILRMGATTLFDRLIKKQGFRDGTEGWIMSIYQSFHTMIVYIQLWEIQHGFSQTT